MVPPVSQAYALDGARLKDCRRACGLSQAVLARRSGVRQQHISNMERRPIPTHARLGTLMRLAAVLEVEAWVLLVRGSAGVFRPPIPPPVSADPLDAHMRRLQEHVAAYGELLEDAAAQAAALVAAATADRPAPRSDR